MLRSSQKSSPNYCLTISGDPSCIERQARLDRQRPRPCLRAAYAPAPSPAAARRSSSRQAHAARVTAVSRSGPPHSSAARDAAGRKAM
eukprot:1047566-Pyramimonas_sp.AAC.1